MGNVSSTGIDEWNIPLEHDRTTTAPVLLHLLGTAGQKYIHQSVLLSSVLLVSCCPLRSWGFPFSVCNFTQTQSVPAILPLCFPRFALICRPDTAATLFSGACGKLTWKKKTPLVLSSGFSYRFRHWKRKRTSALRHEHAGTLAAGTTVAPLHMFIFFIIT